jgi:hypothetical protein
VDLQNKEAVMRMVARGRMGLRRDEVSLLENAAIFDPACMKQALREGYMKKCEVILDQVSPSAEEYRARVRDLEQPKEDFSFPFVRVIIDGSSDAAKTDSQIEYVLLAEERERVTSFFIIHGAPPLNQHPNAGADTFLKAYVTDNVLDGQYIPNRCHKIPSACTEAWRGIKDPADAMAEAMAYATDARVAGLYRDDARNDDMLSWNRVKVATGSAMRVGELRWYYEEIWLPFCDSMTRTLSTEYDRPASKSSIQLPNPFAATSSHCHAARGLVETFLLRQRVLYAIRFLLWNRFHLLSSFLRGEKPASSASFPSWWCPEVHDLGLLVGFLKHGYLTLKAIRGDPALPFTEALIARSMAAAPAADPSLSLAGGAPDYAAQALLFPETKDIEHRIIYILTELTKDLPPNHIANLSAVFKQGVVADSNIALRNAPKSRQDEEAVVRSKKRKSAGEGRGAGGGEPDMTSPGFGPSPSGSFDYPLGALDHRQQMMGQPPHVQYPGMGGMGGMGGMPSQGQGQGQGPQSMQHQGMAQRFPQGMPPGRGMGMGYQHPGQHPGMPGPAFQSPMQQHVAMQMQQKQYHMQQQAMQRGMPQQGQGAPASSEQGDMQQHSQQHDQSRLTPQQYHMQQQQMQQQQYQLAMQRHHQAMQQQQHPGQGMPSQLGQGGASASSEQGDMQYQQQHSQQQDQSRLTPQQYHMQQQMQQQQYQLAMQRHHQAMQQHPGQGPGQGQGMPPQHQQGQGQGMPVVSPALQPHAAGPRAAPGYPPMQGQGPPGADGSLASRQQSYRPEGEGMQGMQGYPPPQQYPPGQGQGQQGQYVPMQGYGPPGAGPSQGSQQR